MTDDGCFSKLLKLQKRNITEGIKQKIKSRIPNENDVNSIIEEIKIDFADHKKYENLSCEILYEHLRIGKLLAQLALNSIKGDEYNSCICHPEITIQETYQEYFEIIKKKKVDEYFLIDRISYYITIFTLLSYKEYNEKCRLCDTPLLKNESKCSACGEENLIENTMRKSNEVIVLCTYCDNKTINGICEVCGSKPNQSKTNLQKTNKDEEKRSVTMRTNSPNTSRNSRIKSNLTTQWACNVCSFNENKSNNINCEVCMSSKFSKINSCVFESPCEVSNANKIDNEEHVENVSIEIDNAKSVDNVDKWACTKCTFSNKITDNMCVVCFEPNICAIDDCELPEETWCCKKCGENNLFDCYKCKICRSPAEFFNKWRCDQCSYYNDKIACRCKVCGMENPFLMKCNLCSKTLVNKKYDKICKQCTIFTEKCTNKQTVDYQDSRETQSGISENKEVLNKRNQRREKINEKQKNLKNEVSQNTETKGKDPIVDKINNEQTGNKNVNKTQSETFKYNSLPNFDENSGKRNKNKTQDKNDDSQNFEKKRKFSNVGIGSNYEKTDNFTKYNVPPETHGSNKSLPKGDRNSGKLNENQIKAKKDIQQKIENKDKSSSIEPKNKMKSKPCQNCKSNMCTNNQHWCTKCENLQWFCQNEGCDGINYQNEYCKQCKAKYGSNFTDCNFWVMRDDGKEVQMWQCGFCLQFNTGTLNKCIKCKNHRDLPCYKKCKCNWNNLNIREKCDKCNADLIKCKI